MQMLKQGQIEKVEPVRCTAKNRKLIAAHKNFLASTPTMFLYRIDTAI